MEEPKRVKPKREVSEDILKARLKKNTESAALVIRIFDGCPRALKELGDLHYDAMLGLNKKFFPLNDDARSLVYRELMKIYERIIEGKYIEDGKCEGWIIKLCTNMCFDIINLEKKD